MKTLFATLLSICLATAGSPAQADAAVERAQIRALLVAQGVSAAEAEARTAVLTDEEAALLADKFDELPAGGRGGALPALVLTAVAVYVVIKLLPIILIGGGVALAVKASNHSRG